MSTIGDLRAGLKANLDPIPGVNVSKYALGNPVGPIIHLWPTRILYHRAHQVGMQEVDFRVEAQWPYAGVEQGTQAAMDKFLDGVGEHSVREALESDRTLGGLCDTLQCRSLDEYEVALTVDNQVRLLAAWSVTVYLGST